MEKFRVPRSGNVDLVFDGTCIADINSRDSADQKRWSEIRIYRTSNGQYVTESLGNTQVPGEKVKRSVQVHDSPDKIKVGLQRIGTQGAYLTDLALDALAIAASNDPDVAGDVVETI